ncbi:MAG: adenylyl-sulfate kinase, partial [Desulfonatronovibrio sp. MSAO_Bac4]
MACPNTVPYRGKVNQGLREQLLGQKSIILWFTGLSGSGKSTIAHAAEEKLHSMGRLTYVFDGDNVRHGLCSDLSFSPEGRAENLTQVSAVFDGIVCYFNGLRQNLTFLWALLLFGHCLSFPYW